METNIKIYIPTYDKIVNEVIQMYELLQDRFWPDSDIVVLGYKQPTYKSKTIKFESLGEDIGTTGLTNQLYDYFSKIKDTHIILGCDDGPWLPREGASLVDSDLLKISHDICKLNDDIGRFGITSCNLQRPNDIISSFEHDNEQIDILQTTEDRTAWHGHTYKISQNLSIWNVKYLLEYLNKYDNLWKWEIDGSQESIGDGWRVVTTSKPILEHLNIWKRGQLLPKWHTAVWSEHNRLPDDIIQKIENLFKL